MSSSLRLVQSVLLVLVAFMFIGPAAASAYGGEHDHSQHLKNSMTVVNYTQSDCASACLQNSQSDRSIVTQTEAKHNRSQPRPTSSTMLANKNENPHTSQPVQHHLATEKLHSINCVYLL